MSHIIKQAVIVIFHKNKLFSNDGLARKREGRNHMQSRKITEPTASTSSFPLHRQPLVTDAEGRRRGFDEIRNPKD